MDHAVETGHLHIDVRHQGIGNRDAQFLLDIRKPGQMRVDTVHTYAEQLDAFLLEVLMPAGKFHQFRGTHRRKIRGMGKEDDPILLLPGTESKILRQGGHCGKIRGILT